MKRKHRNVTATRGWTKGHVRKQLNSMWEEGVVMLAEKLAQRLLITEDHTQAHCQQLATMEAENIALTRTVLDYGRVLSQLVDVVNNNLANGEDGDTERIRKPKLFGTNGESKDIDELLVMIDTAESLRDGLATIIAERFGKPKG